MASRCGSTYYADRILNHPNTAASADPTDTPCLPSLNRSSPAPGASPTGSRIRVTRQIRALLFRGNADACTIHKPIDIDEFDQAVAKALQDSGEQIAIAGGLSTRAPIGVTLLPKRISWLTSSSATKSQLPGPASFTFTADIRNGQDIDRRQKPEGSKPMHATSLLHALVLSLLILAGCSTGYTSDPPTRARNAGAKSGPQQSEKYQDCMREMRGDVFAERTCDVYLQSRESPPYGGI